MKYATLALLSLCAFLSGCDWGHHREAEGHADRHAEVFVTKAPTREYTEIGHYRRKSGDPEEVIAWTRDQARIDDADGAIVDMNAGTRSNGSGNTAAVTTIRWKEAP